MILERLSQRAGFRRKDFLDGSTEFSTRDDAAVIRRVRAFSLIAFAMMFAAVVLLSMISHYG